MKFYIYLGTFKVHYFQCFISLLICSFRVIALLGMGKNSITFHGTESTFWIREENAVVTLGFVEKQKKELLFFKFNSLAGFQPLNLIARWKISIIFFGRKMRLQASNRLTSNKLNRIRKHLNLIQTWNWHFCKIACSFNMVFVGSKF